MSPRPAEGPARREATFLDAIAATTPLFATALRHHRDGEIGKARGIYRELMDQPALTAICLHQLGVIAGQQGDHKRAAELIQRAIRLDPGQPMFYQNLAFSLEQQGNKAGAIDALIDLGFTLQQAEQHAQSVPVYRRILAADPCRYAAHVNLGTAIAWLNDPRAAIPVLLRGIVLHAQIMPELKGFLAEILPRLIAEGVVPADIAQPLGRPTGRIEMIEHALTSLGKALNEVGCPAEAIRCHRMALEIEPGFALGHWNLSLALLTEGDFVNGWAGYEWRWLWDKFAGPRRRLGVPEWRGQPLAGKTIIVYTEQGFGDSILVAPLVRRLAAQAGTVLLEVLSPQLRLFRESFEGGNIEVIERPADVNRVGTSRPYDYVVPLMSLPDRLGLKLEDLPLSSGPYLKPLRADKAAWAKRLAGARGLKVGLTWAGRPKPEPRRSVPLERLRPLFGVEGIAWHSLQIGPGSEQLAAAQLPIADLGPQIKDFADTAAIISELDLVISIDTAVAHLAGAMQKPVWIMLFAVPDWRWQRGRGDSPWFPTARLFRQPAIDDWDSVVAEMGRALAEFRPG